MILSVRRVLLEGMLEVTTLIPKVNKFYHTSGMPVLGTVLEYRLILDASSEVRRMRDGNKTELSLASTLSLDRSPADHYQRSKTSLIDDPVLANNCEYATCGRIFDVEHKKDDDVATSTRFGGLLIRLTREQKHLSAVKPGVFLRLFLKKD